ncbi:MAG: hypothetical protein CO093_04110 [Alphaproteobacteria bacterium CG_4_9_14_3_um_filter_47_13]|nr:MAG: hypothetical protein CO093_04110 [Alphaproteobacteria bacterium CG_4_9_14_3_um_filter_47_13]
MIPMPVYKVRHLMLTCFIISVVPFVASCTLDSPTYLSQKKVEVVETTQQFEMETAKLDNAALKQIAAHYAGHGDGAVDVTVTYNPKAADNSAMMASNQAARIASALRAQEIGTVRTEILPVYESGSSMAYLTYKAYRAQAPEGCNNLEQIDDSAHENFRDYKLGCSTESYIAQQIARPADLLGRANTSEEADARKRANAIEAYKWTNGRGLLDAPATSD